MVMYRMEGARNNGEKRFLFIAGGNAKYLERAVTLVVEALFAFYKTSEPTTTNNPQICGLRWDINRVRPMQEGATGCNTYYSCCSCRIGGYRLWCRALPVAGGTFLGFNYPHSSLSQLSPSGTLVPHLPSPISTSAIGSEVAAMAVPPSLRQMQATLRPAQHV
jgi:hypothetical protein